MSYATPADFLKRKDARTLGQLASDSNSTVDPTSLLTDPNLQAALDDASGDIDAALLAGGRYSTADLAGLTGNSAALLIRLTVEVAMAFMWKRRPYLNSEAADQAIEDAEEALAKFSSGKNIFNIAAVIEAGLPEITGASTVQLQNLNMIAYRCRGNFYPAARLPNNR